eukprot:4544263-Pleurochrysis_carterae.AAC.1
MAPWSGELRRHTQTTSRQQHQPKFKRCVAKLEGILLALVFLASSVERQGSFVAPRFASSVAMSSSDASDNLDDLVRENL